ncbi:MAG: hypothetical protein ACUVR2_05755 [Anaerolineae bacterium]
MKLTKSMVVLATLLAVVLLGAVLPAPQQAQAQTPSITMVGLPDLDPMSGRFINVTRGMDSLGDVPEVGQILNITLEISPALSEFALWIFDGDMGGYWDRWGSPTPPEGGGQADPFDDTEFVLYRDPQVVGNTDDDDLLVLWSGLIMPDDGWFQITVPQDPGAFNVEHGAYYYHLVCRWIITNDYANEQNNFKIAVQGRPFLRSGSTIGFEGFTWKYYQNYPGNPTTLPRTTSYDGTFTFYFNLPEFTNGGQLEKVELYDGDADAANDDDDLNSLSEACRGAVYTWPGRPSPPYQAWLNVPGNPGCNFPPFLTSPWTLAEGANPGSPPDDTFLPPGNNVIIPPNVYYTVSAPEYIWTVSNGNPSGNQEWELYRIALNQVSDADVIVPSLPSGVYTWRWVGLDALNTIFIYVGYDLYPDNPPPPPPPPGTGTPGYWKNHPEAWPVDTITIGGVTYTKEQAIKIMKTNKAKDKTYTMFNALVCAKLNLILGNESSCIALTVLAADNWMKTYGPVGSGVKASSQAWKQGEPLYLELDKYNNGLLCAPHRD